jgi:Holliday junction DNA helicase RuvA
MITSVAGTVVRLGVDQAVVEVGGVGLSLLCTPSALAGLRVGTTGRVATSLVVREDSLTLYGFCDDDERDTFELLQTASGVGPKLARSILAVLAPDDVRRAVRATDLVALTSVPGVGKKGAERLVIELRDRLPAPSDLGQGAAAEPRPDASEPAWRTQVRLGLNGLGWAGKDVEGALDAVADESGDPDIATALRQAIAVLGRR